MQELLNMGEDLSGWRTSVQHRAVAALHGHTDRNRPDSPMKASSKCACARSKSSTDQSA